MKIDYFSNIFHDGAFGCLNEFHVARKNLANYSCFYNVNYLLDLKLNMLNSLKPPFVYSSCHSIIN